jgi:hypothetical protein
MEIMEPEAARVKGNCCEGQMDAICPVFTNGKFVFDNQRFLGTTPIQMN